MVRRRLSSSPRRQASKRTRRQRCAFRFKLFRGPAVIAKALPVDLRRRVVMAVEERLSHSQAAERFRVSAASVSRWRAFE